MSATIFVEGGSNRSRANSAARQAFQRFFQKAGLEGRLPRVTLCGSRRSAFDDFSNAVARGVNDAKLLVDAEGPVTADDPWQHLRRRDNWQRPSGSSGEDCHLMVQVMESWFLADRDAVADFYGQRFQSGSLPRNPAIEEIPKDDVSKGLNNATRRTTKGEYHKGRHSFELIGMIDPSKVAEASPYAKRLLDSLRES